MEYSKELINIAALFSVRATAKTHFRVVPVYFYILYIIKFFEQHSFTQNHEKGGFCELFPTRTQCLADF